MPENHILKYTALNMEEWEGDWDNDGDETELGLNPFECDPNNNGIIDYRGKIEQVLIKKIENIVLVFLNT